MKNIILFLSPLFLFSTGMTASSEGIGDLLEAREYSVQSSWIRAAAEEALEGKYRILKTARDHTIILPELEKCRGIINQTMHPVEFLSSGTLLGMIITVQSENKSIFPEDLAQMVDETISDYRASTMMKQNRIVSFPEAFVVHVQDRLSSLFMAIYEASEKTYPE